jgi:hypothetical protein
MKTKQWNKILKDLGWDDPSYGWTKEKVILKRALKYERTELLEEIGKLKKELSKEDIEAVDYGTGKFYGYNQALQDIINLLNKKDE